MSEQTVCPNCGCPIPAQPVGKASRDAVIAFMEQEIKSLRETVALLRGSRAG